MGHMHKDHNIAHHRGHPIMKSPNINNSEVKFIDMNAKSLKSSNRKNHKINQLNNIVSLSECEVCAITETWLNDDISDCELLPDEFTIYRIVSE